MLRLRSLYKLRNKLLLLLLLLLFLFVPINIILLKVLFTANCGVGVGWGVVTKCSKKLQKINASKIIPTPTSPTPSPEKLDFSRFWLNSDPHLIQKGKNKKIDLYIHNNHLLNFKYRATLC